jgi:hypothetical protein
MNSPMCPWDRFEPSRINFCEEKLCSWVVKPSETWTNISYVLAGMLVLYLARKEKQRKLLPIGIIGIVLGLMSAFFHASGTHIGGWLDISAMHLFTGIGIAYNFRRLKGTRVLPVFLAVVLPSSALVYWREWFGIVLFGIQFCLAYYLEYQIKEKKDYRQLIYVLGIFGLAWAIWWLDFTKVLCDPQNHILSGHGVWHLITGTTFYCIYRFYAQFETER